MPRERIPLYGADGLAFERVVAELFRRLGYDARLTPASHDYGADILVKDARTAESICVQAKHYGSAVGVAAVQEVHAAWAHYGCREAWVVTNATFTEPAKRLAASCGVRLVDGAELAALLGQAGMDAEAVALASGADGDAEADEMDRALTMADVRTRWGCSDAAVKRAIAQGLPMEKDASGRWRVDERDLAAFECERAREARTMARWAAVKRLAPYLAALLVLGAVCMVLAAL
jgi:hypothetical protein